MHSSGAVWKRGRFYRSLFCIEQADQDLVESAMLVGGEPAERFRVGQPREWWGEYEV